MTGLVDQRCTEAKLTNAEKDYIISLLRVETAAT